jgi:hypothetical protein
VTPMHESQESSALGRTNWRRFGAVLGLSVVVTGGVLAMVANGAVAASFSVSGQQFEVGADKLVAHKFVQYGTVDKQVNSKAPKAVVVSAMEDATLVNLCQSVVTNLGAFGDVTLRIEAGKPGGDAVTADDMVVDMEELNGNATFDDIEIGRDASTLQGGPKDGTAAAAAERPQRQAGFFGQQAKTVTITGLQQRAWGTTASRFNLNGLHLVLAKGKNECF